MAQTLSSNGSNDSNGGYNGNGDSSGGDRNDGNDNFFARVYKVVARIPSGRVVSYGQIAAHLGAPRAARTVGWALAACPEHLPWQRVVRADGSVAGGEWATLRRQLLEEEGVEFLLDGRVDMRAFGWIPGQAHG